MIFNSLGSNYDFNFALKTLLSYDRLVYHNELKQLLHNKYGGNVVLLYKGREAIELALKSLNLPQGSSVAINGFTCFAVYEAIKKYGLNVEYLDIEKGDLNFSPQQLEKHIKENPKIKVVIIQNTLGYPCRTEEISKICKENKITLIEDLAHSIGAKYENGKEAGTVGEITVLSFSQDKMIDGISGGALIMRNNQTPDNFINRSFHQQLIDKFYPLFTYFIRKTYSFGFGKLLHLILKKLNLLSKPMAYAAGFHNLPSWYSKLIINQFGSLDENLNHRKNITAVYAKLINPKILSPKIIDNIHLSSNLRFPIFVENRGGLIQYLEDRGIYVSDIWYDAPIAPKKYLSQTNYGGQCPNAELASDAILNLPTHKNVSEKEAEKISNLINLWLKST